MKNFVFVVILAAFGSPVWAWCDNWESTDSWILAAAATSSLADWGQTLNIAAQPERFYERNPILGRHPSRREVNQYFFGSWVVGVALACTLAPETRRRYLLLATVTNVALVLNNRSIGIRVTF